MPGTNCLKSMSIFIKNHHVFYYVSHFVFDLKKKMLTNVLKVLVNDSFKESFYGKIKEKINILTAFFIFYKNCVKTFLKLIVKQYLKSIH